MEQDGRFILEIEWSPTAIIPQLLSDEQQEDDDHNKPKLHEGHLSLLLHIHGGRHFLLSSHTNQMSKVKRVHKDYV